MGKSANWLCTLEISFCEAVGSIHTVTRVPCCHCADAWAALCLRSKADPTSDSDTATVKTAAIVIIRFRQRFPVVSLKAYRK
jgi:hypothetical protein